MPNKPKLPGLIGGLGVTFKTMLKGAVTVQYPHEREDPAPRARGVIALKEENCTVCMLCARECPDWCIYIEGHKEKRPPRREGGRERTVSILDRFDIDYALCMYCGICVEVCPFDALHWSPYFEYNSYTYEGMIHESDVLQGWQEHVLPPPALVADADPKAQELQKVAHDKRVDGVWGVIREQDKKDAYLVRQAGAAFVAPPTVTAGAPAAPSAEAPALATVEAVPAPAEAAPAEAAPVAPAPSASAAAPADLGDVPRIDPTNLPDGIGPVERGRLKKLAELQHRGEAPTTDPVDLLEVLKPILDQMRA